MTLETSCNDQHIRSVGILTWHYYDNFGSLLQAYALQYMLKSLGYRVRIINYRSKKFKSTNSYWKMPLRYILGILYENRRFSGILKNSYSSILFRKRFLNQTRLVTERDGLRKIAKRFDCLISGSDQIWAPNVFNPVYMMDFLKDESIRKISYASSIGLSYLPENLIDTYKNLLSNYYSISVREETGRQLLLRCCGIESYVVVDPTLLLDTDCYIRLEKQPDENLETPYIFCYFLNEENNYQTSVERFARQKNYTVIGVSKKKSDCTWMKCLTQIGPREFLWFIEHAEAVFTDSYHGTIFSLLFHKEFFVFERFSAQDNINQNSRIKQLDAWFSIGNRILRPGQNENDMIPYNFIQFEETLAFERHRSIAFLKGALE